MKDTITQLLSDSISVKQAILADTGLLQSIQDVAGICVSALQRGNKILLAGNDGSAADAQHIAAELVGRFELERRGLPAYAMNTNASSLTAIANDYHYDSVFSRQLEALAMAGDVFFGFSTSGNSPNIVKAVRQANTMGVQAVGMTGASGGELATLCDVCLKVPATNTARVQESHITIGHIVCALIEQTMFGN